MGSSVLIQTIVNQYSHTFAIMRLYLSKMLKNVFFLVFFFVVDDRDDTTSTDNRHYDKSNKAAYGNTTDQAV